MLGESRHHGSGTALLATLSRLADLPTVIIVCREHAESRFQVPQFFGKAQRQPVGPLQENPLGSVEPCDVVIVRSCFGPMLRRPVRLAPTISDGV